MSSKYKAGDKVKIRDDLQDGDWYGHACYVGDDEFGLGMSPYLGKVVTIKEVKSRIVEDYKYYYYRIEEDCGCWSWTDQMIDKKVTTCKFMTSL